MGKWIFSYIFLMWSSSFTDDLQDVIERAVQIGVKKVTFHFCYPYGFFLKN